MLKARLHRMFGASGRCLDVALDHGAFNEPSFLAGLENMPRVVETLAAAGPDALQLTPGQADLLQSIPGKQRPALVMRLDSGNLYNTPAPVDPYDILMAEGDPVLPAVRMDAACVVLNLLYLPDYPEVQRQTVANVARVRNLCERYAMPLMIEPLVLLPNESTGGYRTAGDARLLVTLVRQARELGADLIKADPTERLEDFPALVEAARCPLLVRGGGKQDLGTVMESAYGYLQLGAKGLVFGRNVYMHPDPPAVVRALMALLHQNATPAQVAALIS